MKQPTLTTEQAAAAIVSLINSRPQSPSQAEIADIIACVAGVVHDPKAEALKRCRRAQRAVGLKWTPKAHPPMLQRAGKRTGASPRSKTCAVAWQPNHQKRERI